jgi:hypothetical protein
MKYNTTHKVSAFDQQFHMGHHLRTVFSKQVADPLYRKLFTNLDKPFHDQMFAERRWIWYGDEI